jgi:hypothetical protein
MKRSLRAAAICRGCAIPAQKAPSLSASRYVSRASGLPLASHPTRIHSRRFVTSTRPYWRQYRATCSPCAVALASSDGGLTSMAPRDGLWPSNGSVPFALWSWSEVKSPPSGRPAPAFASCSTVRTLGLSDFPMSFSRAARAP